MEDLKRFIFPVLVAIVLHGFIVSFKLPKQETFEPVLKGNPITIEINAFSPRTIVPKKKEKQKKAAIIPRQIAQKKVVQEKVFMPPIVIPSQQKKVLIEPRRKKKEVVLEDNNKDLDLRNKQSENQIKKNDETAPKKIIEKEIEIQATTVADTENIEDGLEEDRPKENKSISPIQQKAIPMYRQNEQPPYPVMAKQRGYEGEILLSVLVDAEGRVSEVKTKHSSGHLSLDRAALNTVKNWLFTPATVGGRPVSMWVDVPIDFQLK